MIGLTARQGKRYKGVTYRSGFEASIAEQLDSDGIEFAYEPGTYLYSSPREYTPDFVLPGGVVVEAKGNLSPQDRRLLLEVRDQNPGLDLRLLFERAGNRLTPKRYAKTSMTYGEWATKHGFIWAEGPSIPREWILT